ncbi:hypothetical protein PtA15_15A473 [Puccinia triticina]|nr:uncharacterized protein PtA15_15A473 [Puccinia triticina]WAQ92077.1 hypothetical protein PtA15_15A473 [Puccinia triticina]WAR62902.1 hypothetical protein PtB15_15B490 [Puccinia triticina]
MALAAYRETLQRIDKTSKIASVVSVLEALAHKHTVEPDEITPDEKDRSLTLKDMRGKASILDELRWDLLPSLQDHLILLLESLDLVDPKPKPHPDIDSTKEILSNLDNILESTVSSIVSITLKSPLPHEDHDHGLEDWKIFRFSLLGKKIMDLVEDIIYDDLFGSVKSFIQWCTVAYIFVENSEILKEGSDLRDVILIVTASAQDSIDTTMDWFEKSDWAIVQEAWLEASESFDDVVEMLTSRANPSTEEEEEKSEADNDESKAKNELIAEVAKSAVPLAKLGRILIKKTSETISKKQLSAVGTLELNSATMRQLYETPQSILGPLEHLSNLLNIFYRSPRAIRVADQARIRKSVDNLPKDLQSTLSVLDSCLIPFLPRIEDGSPETHLSSFFPTLKQAWDKASDSLMDVIFSFEVERIVI